MSEFDNMLFLDTETTGLEPNDEHRIIEVALVEVRDRKLTGIDFHAYVDPERDIPEEAMSVHGMSRDDLAHLSGGATFKNIVDDLIEYVEERAGGVIYAHHSAFDQGFIEMECRRAGRPPLDVRYFDTLAFASVRNRNGRNNLDALARRFGVGHADRSVHGALIDARLLAHVMLAMTRNTQQLWTEDRVAQVHETQEFESVSVSLASRLRHATVSAEAASAHQAFAESQMDSGP